MPLGNWTSQFFANIYLNELDQFVKHGLRAKYYIRYVDDFVVLHQSKAKLMDSKMQIADFLQCIGLELHPSKSQIIPLKRGITFLGYRIFYKHRLIPKKNISKIKSRLMGLLNADRIDVFGQCQIVRFRTNSSGFIFHF